MTKPKDLNTQRLGLPAVSWDSFETCYRELLVAQGRSSPTSFDLDVAKSVYSAATKAIGDNDSARTLWRTVSAPTGGGKTTAALAFITAYIRQGGSALYLSVTKRSCEEIYASLNQILPTKVAVRTTDHDQEKLDAEREDYIDSTTEERGYTPTVFFQRSQLDKYLALIATHNGFKKNAEELLRLKDGRQRSLILVDESPNDIDVGVFSAAHFELINKLCQDKLGLDGEGDEPQITRAMGEACKQLVETQSKLDRTQHYHPLILSLDATLLAALRRLSANLGLCGHIAAGSDFSPEDIAKAAKLILNAQEGVGQSFVRLKNSFTHGAHFVTFAPDWPLYPGTVLLDATSDIDGYTELTDVRHLEPAPQADYRHLQVHLLEGPQHITRDNPKKLWQDPATRDDLLHWLRKAIIENTEPTEAILVVSWKDIIGSGLLQTLDLGGRQLNLCHFGIGVGSNQWRHCSSVFILGDYVKPSHVTVAETHGIKGTSFAPSADTPIRGLSGDYRITRDGLVLRWLKQLAMRGTARDLSADGIAKRMKLFVLTQESTLLIQNWGRLFPKAPSPKTLDVDDPDLASAKPKRRTSRLDEILKFILSSQGPEVTSGQLEAATGFKLKEALRTQEAKDSLRHTLEAHGWTVVFGRGRGQQTRFLKRT